MKKKLILILIVVTLFLTGCSNSNNINNEIIDFTIDELLSNNTNLVNTVSRGYKYYLPSGMKVVYSNDYNDTLYFNGFKYYLNINLIDYYYNIEIQNKSNDNLYYFKKLDYNGNKGYISIDKNDDLYVIKMYYKYSIIETCVNYDNLKQSIINIATILNSIDINDTLVRYSMDIESVDLYSETYDFYKPKVEDNFIKYVSEYDEYVDKSENNIGKESE